MDKETLGQYGWLVVCVLILSIMVTLATPFGSVIRNGVEGIVTDFRDTATSALDGIEVEDSFSGGGADVIPEVVTNYTVEDVDNSDGKIIKMGATKQMYVVAVLNEDSTVATITKNGEESDGLASISGRLPATVETVVVEPGVVNMGSNAFQGLTALTSVSIPNTVISVGDQAFFECSSLTSIEIPSSVKSIGKSAFQKCTTLADVTLHDGLESIGEKAFQNCKALTSIVIPDSVTSFGNWMFTNCSALEDVTLSNNITAIWEKTFLSCTSLKTIVIPGKVEQIGSQAFGYCSALESVTIPSSVTSIADDAFTNCNKLTTVYGYTGSYAETWAAANGYTFVSIDEIASTDSLALPAKMYAYAGQPIKLYYLNVTRYNSLDGLNVEVNAGGRGTAYADYWEYTPTQAETFDFTLTVRDSENNVLDHGTFTFEVRAASEKASLTALVIGDSTVNAGKETRQMLALAEADNYSLTLLGTRNTESDKAVNQHEGRGGWTAQMYCEKESAASGRVVNEFYNASIEGTNKFDFNYYMTQQGYGNVDCVVLQLGINDVFSPRKDSELTTPMQNYLSYMEYIVNDIHSYDPNIKIVFNLILPCSSNQEDFDTAYENGTIPARTAERCKVNTYTTNLAVLNTFSGMNNVYISHFNSAVDTVNNMSDHVHPTSTGYAEIGTQLYSFVRAIN